MYSTIIYTLAERNLEISNTELTYKGKCEFPYQYSQRRFSRDFSAPDGGKSSQPSRHYYSEKGLLTRLECSNEDEKVCTCQESNPSRPAGRHLVY
jgi:hypothetical protein